MTKPEGYYADAATEFDADDKKMREEFEEWCCSPVNTDKITRFAWGAWQAACASKQKELDALKLLGYIEESNVNYGRAEHIYIVDEDGFDGCTVPVFIKGD